MNSQYQIITFNPVYTDDFIRLNRQWIERYFKIEDSDLKIFADPKAAIIDRGGQIFFARSNDKILGCCALIHHPENGTYELAKMAVDPDAQGLGLGSLLGHALIDYAKQHGVTSLFLEANTRLEASIHLYRHLGFTPVDNYHAAYDRCDLFMTLSL